MKKIYEELELEVIRFSAEDVITTSAQEPEDGNNNPPVEDNPPANPNTNGQVTIREDTNTGTDRTPTDNTSATDGNSEKQVP